MLLKLHDALTLYIEQNYVSLCHLKNRIMKKKMSIGF